MRYIARDSHPGKSTLIGLMLALALVLTGCGGTKILKEPELLVVTEPLSSASDPAFSGTLDWVIFRDGPGTWARNVDWDEYLIRVENLSDEPLQILNIIVVDSLDTPIVPRHSRKQLVKGSKETKRRYKGYGLQIKAGVGAGTLLAAGAVTAATVASAGAAVVYGSSAVAAGVATGLLLVPVLAVGGVVRGVNNSKVNTQIEARQTLLPIALQAGEEKHLNIFFPLSPSPQRIEFSYADSQREYTLIVDTKAVLNGLHVLGSAE